MFLVRTCAHPRSIDKRQR